MTNKSWGDIQQQQARGNNKYVLMCTDEVIGSADTWEGASEDISLYTHKTINVTSSASVTVVYQTSPDEISWYDPLTYQVGDATSPGDKTEGYKVDTEKRSIEVTRYAKYIRVFVYAASGATITVSLEAQM